VVAAVASTGLLSAASPAHAAAIDLQCALNVQLNFNPPLTISHTTGSPTGGGGVVDCQSPGGKYPDLKSGTATVLNASATSSGDPCDLLLTVTGTGKVTWDGGQTSQFNFTANTNPANGSPTFKAKVTSGPLADDTSRVFRSSSIPTRTAGPMGSARSSPTLAASSPSADLASANGS